MEDRKNTGERNEDFPLKKNNKPVKIPSGKNKAAQELGRMGGLARAKKLSPERLSEIATLAVQTRWAKHGRTGKKVEREDPEA